MKLIAVLFSLVITAGYPLCAAATYYRYYDETGGVNVTNDVKSVPERYRAGATVITDKELKSKVKSRERQERPENGTAVQKQSQGTQSSSPVQGETAGASPAAPAERQEVASIPVKGGNNWLSRQLPMLKVIGIIALLVAGFVIAGRLASALAPRMLAIIIKVAMLAAIAVFLAKGFSEKIADAFARIKDESSSAQKAVDKRSEKIQQQVE